MKHVYVHHKGTQLSLNVTHARYLSLRLKELKIMTLTHR